jgi:hypothetical protein
MNLVNELVTQTNLYHDQKYPDGNGNFTPVCAEEILAYIGVIIAMELYKLPKLDDYWKRNGISHMPWFSSIFSRTRFRALRRYFHLRDNTKRPDKNHKDYKLYQVIPIISCLTETFGGLYVPSQNVSIDEMLLGTKCWVSFTQYMPKKPKRFGIKLWALCEAKTGYGCAFQVYTGREDAARPELGLSYRVVFDLMKNYLDKGYRLFIDNFYTSAQLVYDLLQRLTYACGTLRSNREKIPPQLKEQLGTGEAKFWRCDNLVVTHCKGKRDVFAMSSMHGNDSEVITNKRGDKQTTKPKIICDYNENIGGIDLCDQLVSYYNISNKSCKWTQRLIFRLIDMCIVNSLVAFTANNPGFKDVYRKHKVFRETLAHQLVQKLLDRRADPNVASPPGPGRPAQTNEKRLLGKHFASRHDVRRRCVA